MESGDNAPDGDGESRRRGKEKGVSGPLTHQRGKQHVTRPPGRGQDSEEAYEARHSGCRARTPPSDNFGTGWAAVIPRASPTLGDRHKRILMSVDDQARPTAPDSTVMEGLLWKRIQNRVTGAQWGRRYVVATPSKLACFSQMTPPTRGSKPKRCFELAHCVVHPNTAVKGGTVERAFTVVVFDRPPASDAGPSIYVLQLGFSHGERAAMDAWISFFESASEATVACVDLGNAPATLSSDEPLPALSRAESGGSRSSIMRLVQRMSFRARRRSREEVEPASEPELDATGIRKYVSDPETGHFNLQRLDAQTPSDTCSSEGGASLSELQPDHELELLDLRQEIWQLRRESRQEMETLRDELHDAQGDVARAGQAPVAGDHPAAIGCKQRSAAPGPPPTSPPLRDQLQEHRQRRRSHHEQYCRSRQDDGPPRSDLKLEPDAPQVDDGPVDTRRDSRWLHLADLPPEARVTHGGVATKTGATEASALHLQVATLENRNARLSARIQVMELEDTAALKGQLQAAKQQVAKLESEKSASTEANQRLKLAMRLHEGPTDKETQLTDALAKVNADHAQALGKAQALAESRRQALAKATTKAEILAKELDALRSVADTHKTAHEQLARQHAEACEVHARALADMREDHAQALAQVQRAHADVLGATRDAHARALAEAQRAHAAELADAHAALAEAEAKDRTRQQAQAKAHAIVESHLAWQANTLGAEPAVDEVSFPLPPAPPPAPPVAPGNPTPAASGANNNKKRARVAPPASCLPLPVMPSGGTTLLSQRRRQHESIVVNGQRTPIEIGEPPSTSSIAAAARAEARFKCFEQSDLDLHLRTTHSSRNRSVSHRMTYTKSSSKPTGSSAKQSHPLAGPARPPLTEPGGAWTVHYDAATGNDFFFNEATGDTSWSPPWNPGAMASSVSSSTRSSSRSSSSWSPTLVTSMEAGMPGVTRAQLESAWIRYSAPPRGGNSNGEGQAPRARYFFQNAKTGETTWHRPKSLPAPPIDETLVTDEVLQKIKSASG